MSYESGNDSCPGNLGPNHYYGTDFLFFVVSSQKTAQKRRRGMLDSLEKENKVMTIGGIYGTIVDIDEKTVKLKIAEHTVIEVARSSINANISQDKQA